MIKIALTGGAGTGKTTVARMFQDMGAPVLDADEAARAAVAPGAPAWQELRRSFGPEYFREDGALDRGKMSALVFRDPEARRRLEAVVHPAVIREMARRLQELEDRETDLVIVEVPLLFELGLEANFEAVIVVTASPDEQATRLAARDGRNAEEIAGLLRAQLPLADKAARADYVVDNTGDRENIADQVKNIWQKLKNQLDKGRQKG